MRDHDPSIDRRGFLKATAVGIGAASMASELHAETPVAPAKVDPAKLIWKSKSPEMQYTRLGRTNLMVSRVVSGLGGGAGNPQVWQRMLTRGLNYFDTARGYGNSEVNLKDFLAKFRDQLWVTSKATDVAGYAKVDDEVRKHYMKAMKDYLGDKLDELAKPAGDGKKKDQGDLLRIHVAAVEKQKATGEKPDLRAAGKRMAELYLSKLDESLGRMGIDNVDCYMMHGVEIPWMYDCVEVWEAYEKAHKAGKIKHFGISTHKHQKEVLAASVEANQRGPWKIDVIMPAVNPESFEQFKPELAALKKQDVGIIAMKTKGIVNRPVNTDDKKFGDLMDEKKYNEWERAKLYMLNVTDGLIDAVIMQMMNTEQMEKDLPLATKKLTAKALQDLRTIVKLEMAGACHLCGDCETHCPEHIAVTDMIRYHAYLHQYDEKELARELYLQAGYDPAKLCNNCGKCAEVCASHVPVTQLLQQLSVDMA